MLKQLQKQMPYIAVLKLSSGEELVCKIVDEDTQSYTVTKPLTLGQTAKGVQFIPVLMLADPDKPVIIPKPLIVGSAPPELESQYESITTGIALPQKSSIIT